MNAAASELLSGIAKRGYKGAVVEEGVEGTWYQNEVAMLTQQMDFKYGPDSKASNAWNKALHENLSRRALRSLTDVKKIKNSEALSKANIRRWCTTS